MPDENARKDRTLSSALFKPYRFTELEHCHIKLVVEAGDATIAELDAVNEALGHHLAALDDVVANLPDYTEQDAADPTFANFTFGLTLSNGPICFALHAAVPRPVNKSSVQLELMLTAHKVQENPSVRELVRQA